MSSIELSGPCSLPAVPAPHALNRPSAVSWIGLCTASFFLAEANGVTMPFVNTYLLDRGWSFEAIGSVMALAALVSWLMNVPAGLLIDSCRQYQRQILACVLILTGLSMALLPAGAGVTAMVVIVLTMGSLGNAFFGPLTNALALDLVGHQRLDRAVGVKQGWNHAGNIAAAAAAMALVTWFAVATVFYAVAVASILAAVAVMLIRPGDLVERCAGDVPGAPSRTKLLGLLKHRCVLPLLISTVLFHLANAPAMPLVAQKIKVLGGSNVQVAAVVLVAQSVMIPVAILAGVFGRRWGHKRLLAVAFVVLPVRILLYAFSNQAGELVALQTLDGFGAGIFDVTSISICAQSSQGRGHFAGLMGVLGAAVGIGSVAGPFLSGLVVQYCGFAAAFGVFSAIAAVAAVLFIVGMPAD